MQRPEQSKPEPGAADHDPLTRLDSDLASFEASRRKPPPAFGMGGGSEAGFRLVGQMLGGVLGGVGLGWFVDHYAHTSPAGLLIGLLMGSGLSIWSVIRMANPPKAKAGTGPGPATAPPDDEDDDV